MLYLVMGLLAAGLAEMTFLYGRSEAQIKKQSVKLDLICRISDETYDKPFRCEEGSGFAVLLMDCDGAIESVRKKLGNTLGRLSAVDVM